MAGSLPHSSWKGSPLCLSVTSVHPPAWHRQRQRGWRRTSGRPKILASPPPPQSLPVRESQSDVRGPSGPELGGEGSRGGGDDGEAESGTHIPNKVMSRAERIGSSWIRVCSSLRCLRVSCAPASPSPVLWNLGESSVSRPPDSPAAERRGRAPEVEEEGEREKFEKQATRGEPDKPGPGRAEPGLGPGVGGGLSAGGELQRPGLPRTGVEGWGARDPVRARVSLGWARPGSPGP